jgi:hypothetical protein
MLMHSAKHGVTIWREALPLEMLQRVRQISGELRQGRGYILVEQDIAYIKVLSLGALFADGMPYSARIVLQANPAVIEYRISWLGLIALIVVTLILLPTIICLPLLFIGLAVNHLIEVRAIKNFLRELVAVTG